MWNLTKLLRIKFIDLNIFPVRDFGSNVNRITAKHLGQWSTRLYIVSFITGLTILALYTIVQSQVVTKTVNRPCFSLYKNLKEDYGNTLKCSCSLIASTHDRFVEIKPIFHQICSSSFVSDEWRINLTSGLVLDLSIYERRDYRRFLSSHLQFLTKLCQFSIESVNNSIDKYLSSLFITTELLSETDFNERLNLTINQTKSNAPTTFNRLLSLIQSINDGNSIISTYGMNFEYIARWVDIDDSMYAPTQAMIYNNCSCGLYMNCTSEATFILTNSSKIIPIKGLKVGCTPSESFRASTLECFYDPLCINLIEEYTNYTNSSIPLSTTINRFSINTTIDELIKDLFIEEWITSIDYRSYFDQCLPLFCSYTYIQQFNLLYTLTILLGLQGGLTIILKWISPQIVIILFIGYQYRKKRINIVQPVCSLQITPIEIVNTNVHNSTLDLDSMPANVTSQTNLSSPIRCSFKVILMSVMMIFVITVVVIFSIYVVLRVPVTTTTINHGIDSTTSTFTTTTIPACQLKFQPVIIRAANYRTRPISPLVADLNNDNRLDLVFYEVSTRNINVFLGNGNGSFREEVTLLTGYGRSLNSIAVGDFNNDNQLDLAFTDYFESHVGILLGNDDGTIGTVTTFTAGDRSRPGGITVADFNDDSYLDITVVHSFSNNFGLFLGHGDGTFEAQTMFSTGRKSEPSSIAVADFDGDNHPDISVGNVHDMNVGIFRGHGDGTFEAQKSFYTGSDSFPVTICTGDFNNDTRPDVIFSNNMLNIVGMMVGYDNGTLGAREKFVIGNASSASSIVVGDFNCDGHLDIAVGQSHPYSIAVMVGYGNGKFDIQVIFLVETEGDRISIAVGDFNGDNCQDIIAMDAGAGFIYVLLNTCECCTDGIVETTAFIHQ